MKSLVYAPTPWSISPTGKYIRSGGVHGWNIAIIETQEPYTESHQRLFRASAEMYEALRALVEMWDSEPHKTFKDYCKAFDSARELLKKIEQ